MIFGFVVALCVILTIFYLILKLIDDMKLKRLKKKFPEGTETKAIPVSRLDEVPTATKKLEQNNSEELVKKLLD